MLSVAARAGPLGPFLCAVAHGVPGPLKQLVPGVVVPALPEPAGGLRLHAMRNLLGRDPPGGRAARGGLVATASLNGAGRGRGQRAGTPRVRNAGAGQCRKCPGGKGCVARALLCLETPVVISW